MIRVFDWVDASLRSSCCGVFANPHSLTTVHQLEHKPSVMPSQCKRASSIDSIMVVLLHKQRWMPCGSYGDIRQLHHINPRLEMVSHLVSDRVYIPPSHFPMVHTSVIQHNGTLYQHGGAKMSSQGENSNVRTRR